MILQINDKNEIIGYSKIGSIEGGQEVDDQQKLIDFEDKFKPKFYLFQNNEIIVNPNYQEPTVDIPEPQPSAEQQAITDLAINSAEHDQHIQSIEEAITALAQSQGGTN